MGFFFLGPTTDTLVKPAKNKTKKKDTKKAKQNNLEFK